MSKSAACRFALALIGMIMLAACGTRFDQEGFEQQLIEEGENIYLENCARCHQLDGLGFVGLYPNLAGNPIVTLHDPVPIIETVLHGQGSMPPFRSDLNDEETAAVLSYIRNAWGNRASVVYPKQTR